MSDVFKTIRVEQDGIDFVVEAYYDYDNDISHLGKWADKVREYCIDRKRGVLYGQAIDEPDYPGDEPEMPGDNATPEEWTEYEALMAAWEIEEGEYDRAYAEWEENYGLEVLADDLGRTWDYNTYRYWIPGNNYFKEVAKSDQYTVQDAIKWTLQDWKRMENYGNDWYSIGIVVTAFLDGIELGSGSLWGIESDSDDGYFEEVVRDLINEALPEAKPQELISQARAQIAALEKFDPEQMDRKELISEIMGEW